MPGNMNSRGTTTIGASAENPKPANAFSTTRSRAALTSTTVGMPLFSTLAAARPLAVEQFPQPALPTMTAWHPFAFTMSAVLSLSMGAIPIGSSV